MSIPKKDNTYPDRSNKVVSLAKGKLPPQAVDLEELVLGAMLIDRRGLDDVFELIKSADVFYKEAHRKIFEAINSLYRKSVAVDMLTVSDELKKMAALDAAGGQFYLVQLTQAVSSSAHCQHHAAILLQKYIGREIIRVSNIAIEEAYDETKDVFDVLELVTSNFDNIQEVINSGYVGQTWKDATLSIPSRVEYLTNNKGQLTGVPSGLTTIDRFTNGWQPGDFIVIGGDSGMGKTALVMCMILAAAKSGMPTGMFSMEMPVVQLATRAIAVESNYHMKQLTHYGFEKPDYFKGLNEVVDKVSRLPIHADDKPALTVYEMKRKARTMKRKHGIKLLVIDFIQMFSGDHDIRINVSEAARECKNLAKELNIPVIALSQLSREVRKAQFSIPSKHHLKESSAIEEAADFIGLLYRPSYYGFDRKDHETLYDSLELRGEENACMIVGKNRHGSLGNIPLKFIENKTKYVNGEIDEDQLADVPY